MQNIRLSQFVITYGPGSILEGPRGPRIVLSPDIGLFSPGSGLRPDELEVSDQRMSQGLLGGARIFRLPSSAEMGQAGGSYVYRTKPFPAWSLCLDTSKHNGAVGVLYHHTQDCPVCGSRDHRRQEAIRFVRACPNGHLDDVDWPRIVHAGARTKSPCNQSEWFLWHGGGGALSQVELECPICHHRANLGDAYGREWPCSGRFPESEQPKTPPGRPGCPSRSVIVQRQASNLRIPELRTLFTIPPRHTDLHEKLSIGPIRAALTASPPTSLADLTGMLERLRGSGLVRGDIVATILAYPWQDICQAIADVELPVPTRLSDLVLQEFRALIHASLHGAPYSRSGAAGRSVVFEVDPGLVKRFPSPDNGRTLRVTPVPRLQTVTVQTGYRREVGRAGASGQAATSRLRSVSFKDTQGHEWYPGVKFLGEGIFLMLDEDEGWHFPLRGESARRWAQAHNCPSLSSYDSHDTLLFRDQQQRDELHPVFVWWHTIGHALMRAISLRAGYSLASIRERVFLEVGSDATVARGGLILYTAHPGSDGALGGLLALATRFDEVLSDALDIIRVCSNDPLCRDERFRPGRCGGAACYGCVLAPETSCEHRNLWLDREVVLDNLP